MLGERGLYTSESAHGLDEVFYGEIWQPSGLGIID